MNRKTLFFTVLSLLFFTGCVHTSLRVKNGTSQNVTLVSCHSKESINIEEGDSGILGHTVGDVILLYDNKKGLYKDVSILDLKSKPGYVYKYSRYLLGTGFRANMLIDTDKKLFVLSEGEKDVKQPTGYPKTLIPIPDSAVSINDGEPDPVIVEDK